jgi:hypothetical protein
VDGAVFDLTSFTAHLLANAGAGRAVEIVPLLNGQEPLNDPLVFDVSGNAGSEFSYDTSPNPYGTTVALTNYDTYKLNLTLDYALTALTLESSAPNMNHAPTDIALSGASVPENEPVGTLVGNLSTTDPDAGDTFSYALVAGAGSTDNALFSIGGSDLLTSTSMNFEVRSNFSIRVQSADQGALFTEQVFAISVVDVAEPPPVMSPPEALPDGTTLLQWSSTPNHVYTVHGSTNLPAAFSVLQSAIPATPPINSYTDSTAVLPARFWKVSTGPENDDTRALWPGRRQVDYEA